MKGGTDELGTTQNGINENQDQTELTKSLPIVLRPYQQKCVDLIDGLERGSYLIAVATGLGKTVIFSHIKRRGRMLILSHRDELVHQPEKYFDCSFGVEQASEHSNGEEVVSASVQSLVRRLNKFEPDAFDIIITDEAHHAAAPSYKKIYKHFSGARLHLGFTATPNRGDKVRLDDVYDEIIFTLDMKWGIKNKYLSNIRCLQVDIGYDLSNVRKRLGDYSNEQLAEAMNVAAANDGIAKAYRELAEGPTVIFATSVCHAMEISRRIDGSAVVTGKTESKERARILKDFGEGRINPLINVMCFTEGTDLPMIETIMIARPTMNSSLYTQMVGRGTRLYAGKEYLTLIDCVGVTGYNTLCTAPSLFGLDASQVPKKKRKKLNDVMLTDMEDVIEGLVDTPEIWILRTNEVELFAEENGYDMHNVCWKMLYNGSFVCDLRKNRKLMISTPNEIGRCNVYRCSDKRDERLTLATNIPVQEAFDRCYVYLTNFFEKTRFLWDKAVVDKWGAQPATSSQIEFIKSLLTDSYNRYMYGKANIDYCSLNKYQANVLITKLKHEN